VVDVQNVTQFGVNQYTNVQGVALNLINGHLTEHRYIACSRGFPSQNEPKNWFRSSENSCSSNRLPFVLRVQPFASGGYEATLMKIDLDNMVRNMDSVHIPGKREEGIRDENNIASSINRAKQKMRWLIKSMGCDRLGTFTKRENDSDNYMTPEQWGQAWDRLLRLCKRANCQFQYVAVLERHKSGAYHLHAAMIGRVNLELIRRLWYIALGAKGNERGSFTPGGFNISYKSNMTRTDRLRGVSKYISKYVSKQLGHTEFNKKRYWSSRHQLPPSVRYMLAAESIQDAIFELSGILSLSLVNTAGVKPGVFLFPSGNGLWFNYDESLGAEPPF
jgi:hypothetical protein